MASDKEFYQLQISMSKALSSIEIPLKAKHARATIIGTFNNQGGHTFWTIALRQPVMDNRITAWKFCNLLHKVLREGHNLCSQHSMRHRKWLADLGKLFSHLGDTYGLCIMEYTKFLIIRIEFNERNPRFPSNMQISKDEFKQISGGDINFNYQLALEVFDYLDAIIALQATVNNSITMYRINSMTPSGQCLVSVFIPCIQDSNALYDFAVRLMFKLHANIAHDLLLGHRQRFHTIFIQLKSFYSQSSKLQYFHNLITVPKLPSNIPNFVSQGDYSDYVSPVVVVPEVEVTPEIVQEEEKIIVPVNEGILIDPIKIEEQTQLQLPKIDYEQILREKNLLIDKLQNEIHNLKTYINSTTREYRENAVVLENEIATLNNRLSDENENIKRLKTENNELETTARDVETLKQMFVEEEQKYKTSEIKYTKLKELYSQISNEHVKLLRQNFEVNKRLDETIQTITDLEKSKENIKSELNDVQQKQTLVQEVFQQASIERENEKDEFSQQFKQAQEEYNILQAKYEELNVQKNIEISNCNENLEQLRTELEEFRCLNKSLLDEKELVNSDNHQLRILNEEIESKYQQALIIVAEKQEEKSALQNQCEEIETIKLAVITALKDNLKSLENELDNVKTSKILLEEEKVKLIENHEQIQLLKNDVEIKYEKAVKIIEEKEEKIQEINNKNYNIEELKNGLSEEFKKLQHVHSELSKQFNDLQTEKIKQEDDFKTLHEEDLTIARVMSDQYNTKIEEMKLQQEQTSIQNEEYLTEIEDIKIQLTEKVNECFKLQNEILETTRIKDTENKLLTTKLKETELNYQKINSNMERLGSEKSILESELQDLLLQQEQLEVKQKETNNTIKCLKESLVESKIHGETSVKALLEACIKSCETLATKTISNSEYVTTAGASAYFMLIVDELQDVLTKLTFVHDKYLLDDSNVESLARKIITSGHLLASVYVQGISICMNSADIENGERTADTFREWNQDIIKFFETLLLSQKKSIKKEVGDLQKKLESITKQIHGLTKQTASSEQIGDMVEAELALMDKSIEEAAAKIEELLSQSRATDSGIKLEVNEKILDACTTLMASIRILVQKSRILQAEIILLGKGTATEKEFYKRNHQWTEGLISAAKSVAQGANFLVTASNKAVSGDAKHQFDLIVAAQDIAASTAQLVVASRVKAPRGNKNLEALSKASRNVTQATGAVVATAKDSSKRLEDSQDLDFTSLTVHQAKTFEMNLQVKVLELEQALNIERHRLYTFRKQNYSASD